MIIKPTNFTKFLLLAIISFSFCYTIKGQCIIDAGTDRNVCLDEILDGPKLFGESIEGDIVQFAWHSEYFHPSLNQTYYASSMLNDTTVLEPTIEQHYERTVTYYLTGTTSANEICTDSVTLNFSDWQFLLTDKATGKLPNDTVQLWIAAYSNWPHVQYEWSPNFMISDTTVERPFVWNDVTTFYNLIITDSIGCSVIDDVFEVYVNTNSTKEEEKLNLNIYPNPFTDKVRIDFDQPIQYVELLDLNGRSILKTKDIELELSDLSRGNYILNINYGSNKTVSKLLNKIDR